MPLDKYHGIHASKHSVRRMRVEDEMMEILERENLVRPTDLMNVHLAHNDHGDNTAALWNLLDHNCLKLENDLSIRFVGKNKNYLYLREKGLM